MDPVRQMPASLKCPGTLDPGLFSDGDILDTEQADGKNVLLLRKCVEVLKLLQIFHLSAELIL